MLGFHSANRVADLARPLLFGRASAQALNTNGATFDMANVIFCFLVE
jgi:hypothetical protein